MMLSQTKKNIGSVLFFWLMLSFFFPVKPVFSQSDGVDLTATVNAPLPVDAPVMQLACVSGIDTIRANLSAAGGAANREYQYEIGDTALFNNIVVASSWSPQLFYAFNGVNYTAGTYYLRAKSRDTFTLDESPYSNVVDTLIVRSCGSGGGGGSGGGIVLSSSSNANNTNRNGASANRNLNTSNVNAFNHNSNIAPITNVQISIEPSTITNQTAVTLNVIANNASQICYQGNGLSSSTVTCIPYAESVPLTLSPGDGDKSFSVWLRNNTTETPPQSLSIFLDQTPPPIPEVFVPEPVTTDRFVNLGFVLPPDVTGLYIAGDGILNNGNTFEWINPTRLLDLILSGPAGIKTITVTTRDMAGNVSPPRTITIELIDIPLNENQNVQTNTNAFPVFNTNQNQNVRQNNNRNAPLNRNQNRTVNQNANRSSSNANEHPPLPNPNANLTPPSLDQDNDNVNSSDETDVYHTDPAKNDTDDDGLSDGEEINITHTDPLVKDTDGDLLSDADEINQYHTDPNKPDTDGDTFSDASEIQAGTNPLDSNDFPGKVDPLKTDVLSGEECASDKDKDGLSACLEQNLGTDPSLQDTDGDSYSDGDEVLLYGTNPLDPNDNPDTNTNLKIVNFRPPNPDQEVVTTSDWFIRGVCLYPSTVKVYLVDQNGQEEELGQSTCLDTKIFLLEAEKNFEDGYYNLIARRYGEDNTVIEESRSIAIVVDKTRAVKPPRAVALDDKPLPEDVKLIARVEITNNVPTVYCQTVPGARVEATFQSIVTSSAMIADATTGNCSVTAAQALEKGDHRVVLYAVTPQGLRSSKVIVPFTITDALAAATERGFSWWWLLLLLVLTSGATYWYYLREKRKKLPKQKEQGATI